MPFMFYYRDLGPAPLDCHSLGLAAHQMVQAQECAVVTMQALGANMLSKLAAQLHQQNTKG